MLRPEGAVLQIYVNGEFIGGSDLLMEMHQKGELESVLHPPK